MKKYKVIDEQLEEQLKELGLTDEDISDIEKVVNKKIHKKNKEEEKNEKLKLRSMDGKWEKHDASRGAYNIYRIIASWIRNGAEGQPTINTSPIQITEKYEDYILDGDILYLKRKD